MTIQELSDEMRKERARCSTHCGTWNSEDRDCEIYGEQHCPPLSTFKVQIFFSNRTCKKKQGDRKMKDEEMAEESFKKYRTTDEDYEDLNGSEKMLVFSHEYGAEKQYRRLYKQGFLAGLKAGRPQWHKVADGDLPKIENRIVLCVCIGGYINNEPNYVYKLLTSREFCLFQPVIAWCEIPTFDKE